jgi:VIT1/CCC1 family predicted Fe2+/Mn2+ transporter
MDKQVYKYLLQAQENEITEYHVYKRLAKCVKEEHNKKILLKIADEELKHGEIWEKYTGKKVRPSWIRVFFYYIAARILGFTFVIKLMERGEELAGKSYETVAGDFPEVKKIISDEIAHEEKLIAMLDEERLRYMGSIVLGLNDALVELTGALAGFTFALQNSRLIATVGLITGVAASFSMAASEYLSTKAEGNSHIAVKSSVYTGIAYIFTVIALVLPYFLGVHYVVSLGITLAIALAIICFFNFYISVAKDEPFWSRFIEMSLLSLGVAALSFGFGVFIRKVWGIEV